MTPSNAAFGTNSAASAESFDADDIFKLEA